MPAGQKCQDTSEGVFRFVVLYLARFKDSIRLREGSRLEVTFAVPLLPLFAAVGACRLEGIRLLYYRCLYQYAKDAVKQGGTPVPDVLFVTSLLTTPMSPSTGRFYIFHTIQSTCSLLFGTEWYIASVYASLRSSQQAESGRT